MGILIGIGKDGAEAQNAYGVKKVMANSGSELIRVHKGNPSLHATLPWHSQWKQCVLDGYGSVAYYLHPNDRDKKEDGTPSVLDGSDGQVMVEVPESWWKVESDVDEYTVMLSAVALPGYTYMPGFYIGSFEATIDRSAVQLLSAIPPETSQYRGGDNNASYDSTDKDLRGKPVGGAGGLTLAGFRDAAREGRWEQWNITTYHQWCVIYWAYCIEYADQNCQLPFNAALTPEGFRQGGLGPGATLVPVGNHGTWNGHQAYLRPGLTNALGNATGVVPFNMPPTYVASYGALTLDIPSYRGIENPFGHMGKFIDGAAIVASDTNQELYINADYYSFHDHGLYMLAALLPTSTGYGMRPILTFPMSFCPETLGGSSTTYMCDEYEMAAGPGGGQDRSLIANVPHGAQAGMSSLRTTVPLNSTYRLYGARLSFIP